MLREEVEKRLRIARIRPSKSLSQHFLVDDSVLGAIIRGSKAFLDGVIVEIGAGLGTLTEALAKRAPRVIAYEPDRKLVSFLQTHLVQEFKNVEVREKYIHRYELDRLLEELDGQPLAIVSNLPYQITSEFLLWLIANSAKLKGAVVMLQLEVAKRLNAHPGSKSYGSLSVYAQSFVYTTELLFVPQTAFIPVPQVDSALLRISALSSQPILSDWNRYYRVIETAFKHRRKTIANAIHSTFTHFDRTKLLRLLANADILPDRRGDTLTKEEFIRLARTLFPDKAPR